MKVFLSSTIADLKPYREAAVGILRRLGFDTISLDDFGTFHGPPLEGSERAIATSDLFVLIVAHRYGFIPPYETKGLVELEYELALQLKKPVLAFVVRDDVPWPVQSIDLENPARERLEQFKSRLFEHHLVSSFSTPEELAQQIAIATSQYSRTVEPIPFAAESPTGRSEQEAATVIDVIKAVNEIRLELTVLRGVIADAAQNLRQPPSRSEAAFARAASFLGPGAVSTNPARCFLVMPYSEQWSDDVEKIVLEVCNEVGLEFTIAKSMDGRFIPHDIWNGITGAGVIVADLSGANPNVTYEVGLADVLGREVVMICQGTKVPFDFLGQRLVQYEDSLTGARLLREELTVRLRRHRDRISKPQLET